jgi:hypothetical protein
VTSRGRELNWGSLGIAGRLDQAGSSASDPLVSPGSATQAFPEALRTRSDVLPKAAGTDAAPVVASVPRASLTFGGPSSVSPPASPQVVGPAESTPQGGAAAEQTAPVTASAGVPSPELHDPATPQPSETAPVAVAAPALNRNVETPAWVTVGIAQFLGTLTGLVVGLSMLAVAAYIILPRLGCRSLTHLVPFENICTVASSQPPTGTAERLHADDSVEPRKGRLDTIAADFADGRFSLQIVNSTFDRQQAAKEERARQQNREILRQILEDNVSLRAKMSARRKVG